VALRCGIPCVSKITHLETHGPLPQWRAHERPGTGTSTTSAPGRTCLSVGSFPLRVTQPWPCAELLSRVTTVPASSGSGRSHARQMAEVESDSENYPQNTRCVSQENIPGHTSRSKNTHKKRLLFTG